MVFENNSTYLIAALITLAGWLVLYWRRKDLRKEMLAMSILFSIIGIFMEAFFWVRDWWRPPLITNTLIGIEDVIFAFGIAGVSAVLYEEIFKKRLSKKKIEESHHGKHLLLVGGLFLVIVGVSHFVLELTSATTWIFAITAPILVMWYLRRDLIANSIATGIILTLMAFVIFAILNLIEPGFVYSWWLFDNLSGIVFLGVPLEDIIWFFTAGAFMGPFYEFWQRRGLKSIN